jgi:DNA-directed RNA polymerase specialized sigma24 family protein
VDPTTADVPRVDAGEVPWRSELVDAYRTQRLPLVRLAFVITGDREAADDLVHEAFLATHRAGDRVLDVAPYLRAAVANRSRSWLRRRRLERRHAESSAPGAVFGQPDELWDALERLTPRQRTAVVLRYYEALPDAVIADILGCREATVRTAIHRALLVLRKEIDR